MPRSKKKQSGNGRSRQFERIICVSELVLIFLLWILNNYFQATIGELLALYLIGSIVLIVVLRAIDRRAIEHAMDII